MTQRIWPIAYDEEAILATERAIKVLQKVLGGLKAASADDEEAIGMPKNANWRQVDEWIDLTCWSYGYAATTSTEYKLVAAAERFIAEVSSIRFEEFPEDYWEEV